MRLHFGIALLVLGFSKLHALDDFSLLFKDSVTNALGNSDRKGFASWWYTIPSVIPLGGEKLPLAFHFTTNPSNNVGSLFGANWCCPLLESCLVEKDERTISVFTPGGAILTLYSLDANSERFASGDSKFHGIRKSDAFVLTGKSGEQLIFKGGRVSQFKAEKLGSVLRWNYASGRLTSLTSEEGKELLRLVRGPGGGINALVVGGQSFPVHYKSIPQVDLSGVIVNLVPSLAGLDWGGGAMNLEYTYDSDNRSLTLQKLRPKQFGVPEFSLAWLADSGEILKDSLYTRYAIKAPAGGSGRPEIFAWDKSGGEHSYIYDSKTGIARLTHGAISEIRTYNLTKGENYGKIRKVIVEKDGATTNEVLGYFDANGKLLRKVTNQWGVRIESRTNANGEKTTFIDGIKVEKMLPGQIIDENFIRNFKLTLN